MGQVDPSNQVNSGSYDLNLIKRWFSPLLNAATTCLGVLKWGNSFLSVETEKLHFLDMRNYLVPNFSYSKFLSSYQVPQVKGFSNTKKYRL